MKQRKCAQGKQAKLVKFILPKNIDPLEHSLEVLEFPKILRNIADRCLSDAARRIVLILRPSSDEELLKVRQELIGEIRQFLATGGQLELAGLGDPEPFIDKAAKDGILSEEQLWQVAQVSRIVHKLTRISADRETYFRMRALLDGLESTPSVHSNIERFIAPPGVFKEDASERLSQLRIAKKDIHDKLQDKLQSMLESDKYKDYWQEQLVTLRNERFVLPLKAEHKQHIPSVIHDRSASGMTIFIEPIEIVPLNNQLRELELEERSERLRIMRNLSEIIGAYGQQLISNLAIMHQLDFLIAVAYFADEFKANSPSVAAANPFVCVGARHPLLIIEKGFANVVPLDMELSPRVKGVIITGPNMGGKTVALKTIGLLTVMASCGIPITAEARTQLPLFDKIFADIGDEQSVEASVSSFASHIIHYKQAVENADERTLVIFDELGSSTDPQEGTPIAWALIEKLLDRKATVIANTHLGGLLGFATTRDDIENGAMEFDQNKMEPTYRFLLGVPGRSWANEISELLGFPAEILHRARELSEGGTALDKIIAQLQHKLADLEDNQRRVREERNDIKNKRLLVEGLIASNQIKEKEMSRLRRVYEEQRDTRIAAAIERELDKIQHEWNAIIAKQPPAPDKRRKGDDFLARIRKRLKHAEKTIALRQGRSKKLEREQRVFIYRLHKWGDVLDPTDEHGFVRVLVGNLPLRIHSSGVDTESEFEKKKQKSREKHSDGGVSYSERKVPQQVDIRGLPPDEAWDKLDHVLDDAIASDTKEILIVHGKGKGVLRRLVRDKLHLDKRIEQLMLPDERMGGDGATIAVMKK